MPRIFKKRKGFHGVRKWQLEESSGCNRNPQQSTSSGTSSQDDTIRPKPCTPSLTKKGLSAMRNMSSEKLKHSDFKKMDEKMKTRSLSKRLGVARGHCIEDAPGTKIQDFTILSQTLEQFAICSSCRSAKSKLKIKQDNQKRKGLAESLFIICTN